MARPIALKFIATLLIGSGETRANLLLRLSRNFQDKNFRILSKIFMHYLHREYGCYIHPEAEIGAGFQMIHPTGIVIGAGSILGHNVTVYQQVTIGTAREGDYALSNYPTIGDGTVIYAGAKVLGKITIGRNCIIGANAVVTKSVPDDSIAIGIPAHYFTRSMTDVTKDSPQRGRSD